MLTESIIAQESRCVHGRTGVKLQYIIGVEPSKQLLLTGSIEESGRADISHDFSGNPQDWQMPVGLGLGRSDHFRVFEGIVQHT